MTDVYRGMYPFLIIQIIGLFLCSFLSEPVLVAAESRGVARLNR